MKTLIFACFVLVMAASAFAVKADDSEPIYWGVYHPNPGEIPVGNLTDEYLLTYGTYYHGFANGNKILYLTFDAGYEDGNTVKILDALRERGITAAFFLTGNYMKSNPEMVLKMIDDGHLIGNHSMTHPDIHYLSCADFSLEISMFEDLYKQLTGVSAPLYFRPPSCAFNRANLKTVQAKGYKTMLWSIAYDDWQADQPTRCEAFAKIIPNLHPGAIILLHTTSTTNAAIMGELLDKCLEKGYVFKSLDDLPE